MKALGSSLMNQVTSGNGLGGLLGGLGSKSGTSSSNSNNQKPGLNLGNLFGH